MTAVAANFPWRVQFTPDDGPVAFTAEQGEVMGLTPPEPAPLVVTCNGHSVELTDEEAGYDLGISFAITIASHGIRGV